MNNNCWNKYLINEIRFNSHSHMNNLAYNDSCEIKYRLRNARKQRKRRGIHSLTICEYVARIIITDCIQLFAYPECHN